MPLFEALSSLGSSSSPNQSGSAQSAGSPTAPRSSLNRTQMLVNNKNYLIRDTA